MGWVKGEQPPDGLVGRQGAHAKACAGAWGGWHRIVDESCAGRSAPVPSRASMGEAGWLTRHSLPDSREQRAHQPRLVEASVAHAAAPIRGRRAEPRRRAHAASAQRERAHRTHRALLGSAHLAAASDRPIRLVFQRCSGSRRMAPLGVQRRAHSRRQAALAGSSTSAASTSSRMQKVARSWWWEDKAPNRRWVDGFGGFGEGCW